MESPSHRIRVRDPLLVTLFLYKYLYRLSNGFCTDVCWLRTRRRRRGDQPILRGLFAIQDGAADAADRDSGAQLFAARGAIHLLMRLVGPIFFEMQLAR